MSTRVLGSLLLLLALVLAFNVGDFAAQDPAQTTTPATRSTQTATQTDLSGTYAGTFNCEAAGLMGDTTLTITGNQFTTADGKSGRIVASNSGGYTAVALQLGESPTGATAVSTAPPQIISLRARKKGDRLTLMSVPGSTMKCSFAPTSATARGRKTTRTPAATGTQVAMPEAVPEQTPMPSPSPSPTATPSPEPQPSPEPNPSPRPSPMPTPMPNPSPSASPSPTASPTPSPTPALSHR